MFFFSFGILFYSNIIEVYNGHLIKQVYNINIVFLPCFLCELTFVYRWERRVFKTLITKI